MEEVHQRLSEIRSEISQQIDFLEFAATSDEDYQMAQARLDGLRKEKSQLEEMV
jgi:predicted nuclease with TOPRIM domain